MSLLSLAMILDFQVVFGAIRNYLTYFDFVIATLQKALNLLNYGEFLLLVLLLLVRILV